MTKRSAEQVPPWSDLYGQWRREFQPGTAWQPIQRLLTRLPEHRFPTPADLNALCDAVGSELRTVSGRRIQFSTMMATERSYEQEIEASGLVPTRERNLHDLFNALIWRCYPKSKAMLNACHVKMLERHVAGAHRGRRRDRLTLFDESGIIILTADPEIALALAAHRWEDLFVLRRRQTMAATRWFVFGHALLEKLCTPYPGITGKAMIFQVSTKPLSWSLARQIEWIDSQITGRLNSEEWLAGQERLQPVPLLGIPAWHHHNHDPAFYRNKDHFRPRHRSLR